MITVVANPNGTTVIGRVGENEYRQIQFPIGDYLAEYPNATFALLNRRPGDSTAYPVSSVEVSAQNLNWTVIQSDVSAQGLGKCELEVIDGGTIAKSIIYLTRVLPALGNGGDAPEPWISWQAQFQQMKEDAESAARTASEASAQAIQSAQAAAEQAAQYAYRVYVDNTALVFEKVNDG